MTVSPMRRLDKGFTLLELAISIFLLGFFVGMLTIGQSLYRSAELKNVSTESYKYNTALQSFQNQYLGIPGDMRDATRYWGAANTAGPGGECLDPLGDAGGTIKETCNGNANGRIDTPSERARAWQHLGNAGVIGGGYSGRTHGGSIVLGSSIPHSEISDGAGWDLNHGDSDLSASSFNKNALALFFAGAHPAGDFPGHTPVVNPEEALQIDLKVDDGVSFSGKVWGMSMWANPMLDPGNGCMGADSNPNVDGFTRYGFGDYDASDASVDCMLVFWML